MLDRRDFIRLGGLACLPLLSDPLFARAASWLDDEPEPAAPGTFGLGAHGRAVILVELSGGNDGLNTVVPHRDDRYRELRPRLALDSDTLVPLTDELGLHRSLAPLAEAWSAEDLAVVQGLGYPRPNRSHFRSIEIWETGSDSNEFLGDGWLARSLPVDQRPEGRIADSILLGKDNPGPLDGANMTNIVLKNPKDFARKARRLKPVPGHAGHRALDKILDVNEEIRGAAKSIEERRKAAPKLGVNFPSNNFGKQCETAAQLLTGEVPVSIIKLFHGGFDTHANQLPNHARLLSQLADGLAALRNALQKAGLWDRVLISTYSEFGRRANENGSNGTDHGTAAPHFVLGGQVKGGLYGKHPDLGKLEKKDLVFTTDYRRLYATIQKDWWDLPSTNFEGYQPLGLIEKAKPAKEG